MKCCICGAESEDGIHSPVLILTELGRRVLFEFEIFTRPGATFSKEIHEAFGNLSPEELLCMGYVRLSMNAAEGSEWYCRRCFKTRGYAVQEDKPEEPTDKTAE